MLEILFYIAEIYNIHIHRYDELNEMIRITL